MTHKGEINQLIEVKPELKKILGLANKDIEANKDIKAVIISAFHIFKKLSRDMEDIFKIFIF